MYTTYRMYTLRPQLRSIFDSIPLNVVRSLLQEFGSCCAQLPHTHTHSVTSGGIVTRSMRPKAQADRSSTRNLCYKCVPFATVKQTLMNPIRCVSAFIFCRRRIGHSFRGRWLGVWVAAEFAPTRAHIVHGWTEQHIWWKTACGKKSCGSRRWCETWNVSFVSFLRLERLTAHL